MSETTSLKALANKVLQRNNPRNKHETRAHFNETKSHQNKNQNETKQAIDLSPYIGYYNERAGTYEFDANNVVKSRADAE